MAFGSGLDDQDEVMSEINMTPLVDVMLVLLIIFILAMPVITHSVKIDLPQVSHEINTPQTESVALTVAEQGGIYWNGEQIAMAQLKERLARYAHQPSAQIQLSGDRQVAYEHIVEVMAAVQQAGITKLGFVTEPARP